MANELIHKKNKIVGAQNSMSITKPIPGACFPPVTLKVIVANSVDPDQTVHAVCLYAKCKFEKFARRCSR